MEWVLITPACEMPDEGEVVLLSYKLKNYDWQEWTCAMHSNEHQWEWPRGYDYVAISPDAMPIAWMRVVMPDVNGAKRDE